MTRCVQRESHTVRQTVLAFLPNPKHVQIVRHTNSFILKYVKRINMELAAPSLGTFFIVKFYHLSVNKKDFNWSPICDVPLEPNDQYFINKTETTKILN